MSVHEPPQDPAPHTTEFGKRVRQLRRKLGLTQERLGQASGVDRAYVGRVERGGHNVGLTTILRLAKGLEVDPAELVHGLTVD